MLIVQSNEQMFAYYVLIPYIAHYIYSAKKKRIMGKFNIYFIHFKINLTLKNVTYQNEIWHSVCQDVSVYCTGEITTHMILNVR